MIKRSFFALSKPILTYDLLEPNPEAPRKIDIPDLLTLLLPEPIDDTRPALIQKGNPVKKAEKLFLYNDSAAYVLSPVAGSIKSVGTFSDDFSRQLTWITIERDPEAIPGTDLSDISEDMPMSEAAASLQALPGAPPFDILADETFRINTIVVMGVDTDLLTTTSQYISMTHPGLLEKGAQILKRITKTSRVYLALPGTSGQNLFKDLSILETGSVYPNTLPAMIMKNHLDKILPTGRTPQEMGICFIQAEAVVSLGRTFEKKEPVFEKCLTLIDKNGARHRLEAVIGTPLSSIFSQVGIQIRELDRIVIGGPMQGFATFTPHHPVTPDMDTVLIQDRDFIPSLTDDACINCGKCIQVCPADIPVNLLIRFLQASQFEAAAEKCDLESCIYCGLCAYVCTSRIALCQYIRLGKHEFKKIRTEA